MSAHRAISDRDREAIAARLAELAEDERAALLREFDGPGPMTPDQRERIARIIEADVARVERYPEAAHTHAWRAHLGALLAASAVIDAEPLSVSFRQREDGVLLMCVVSRSRGPFEIGTVDLARIRDVERNELEELLAGGDAAPARSRRDAERRDAYKRARKAVRKSGSTQVTDKRVAEALGVTERTLVRWRDQGIID